MSFAFLFYSHTDYKDLWNIIQKTPIPSFYTKYIALNTSESINGFQTIQYNDSLSYSENFFLNSKGLIRIQFDGCV